MSPSSEREVELIEQVAVRVGMTSLMNNGAASCVHSEGCNGVTQEHLIAFAREIALHCAAALSTQPQQAGWTMLEPLDLNQFAEVCHDAHIDFCLDKFPSEERALEHHYIGLLNRMHAAPLPPVPGQEGGTGE